MRGRPALGPAKRSKTVRVQVTPAELSAIASAAKRADATVSDWGRPLLVAAAGIAPTEPT